MTRGARTPIVLATPGSLEPGPSPVVQGIDLEHSLESRATGGDVSCADVCGDLGDGSVCVNACPSGWVGYSSPGCTDPEAEGSCTDCDL